MLGRHDKNSTLGEARTRVQADRHSRLDHQSIYMHGKWDNDVQAVGDEEESEMRGQLRKTNEPT